MSISVQLPRLSDTHDESLITFWHVSEGDEVKKDDTIVEVQTEKAVSEIQAPESGIIKEIRKKEETLPPSGIYWPSLKPSKKRFSLIQQRNSKSLYKTFM